MATVVSESPSRTFTGRFQDPESGLIYYRARYYDPQTGRFTSEDPMGFLAGDANFYRYVFNDPVNLTDPSGHGLPAILLAAAGAVAREAAIGCALGGINGLLECGTPEGAVNGCIQGAAGGACRDR